MTLIERLREAANDTCTMGLGYHWNLHDEAADCIEELEQQLACSPSFICKVPLLEQQLAAVTRERNQYVARVLREMADHWHGSDWRTGLRRKAEELENADS